MQSAALPLLAACAPGVRPSVAGSAADGVWLPPVQVSEDRVIRKVAGLRPYRPSGFVVRADKLGDKLLVHNYGHGGGGVTLSWGSARLAAELAAAADARRAAVLGCGVIGLSTARLLQDRGWDVTIYARDLPPNTTSNIAGAQWSPASVFDDARISPAFREQYELALRWSYRQFQHLVGERYGVRWISNYYLRDQPFADDASFFRTPDVYPRLGRLARHQHPFPAPYAVHLDTLFIEPPVYLPALLADFRLAGGQLVVREFTTVDAVAGLPEPVVVNCTGLGARALFDDQALMPIKGQLTVLRPQSEIDYLLIYRDLYMFPRRDGILLGGTHERGDWSLEPDAVAAARILDGHRRFFDDMARARRA